MYNQRFIFSTQIREFTPIIKTISLLFLSTNWSEREAWDMFGVLFIGHNDLRRILTDYGFAAFPLRKDFPLTGYVEVYYNTIERSVVYTPVTLSQAFRKYIFENP
jgi:NADH-quinone oxidoreductase subunit C